jgi:hypothetical protein
MVRNENGFSASRIVVLLWIHRLSHRHFLLFPFSCHSKHNQSSSDDGDEKRAFSASVSVQFGMRTDSRNVVTSDPFPLLISFNRRTKHRLSLPMVLFSLLHSQWRESVAQVSPLYCILHSFEFMAVHPFARVAKRSLTFAFLLFSPNLSDLHCDCLLRGGSACPTRVPSPRSSVLSRRRLSSGRGSGR